MAVGSGTLITFPVLLAVGYSPLTANVSNTLGLVPGSLAGAFGYRRELRAQRGLVLRLAGASLTGGLIGAVLLLALPAGAFDVVVPVLVALAVILVAAQPLLSKRLATPRLADVRRGTGALLLGAVLATGVYGGYFGAAQGVLLLGVMGLLLPLNLQELNGIKNLLTGLVNAVAAIVFVIAADIAWEAVALIAVGSAAGGFLGARVARRLSPATLRVVVVVVGLTAFVQLVR